jgi:hypothetical protein
VTKLLAVFKGSGKAKTGSLVGVVKVIKDFDTAGSCCVRVTVKQRGSAGHGSAGRGSAGRGTVMPCGGCACDSGFVVQVMGW